jgi:hypothetical protein
MVSLNNYIPADLDTTNADEIMRALLAAGYTNPLVPQINYSVPGTISDIDVQVDENSVGSTTMKDAINNNHPTPTLSASASSVSCAGDGVATNTVTISDSRGASASGKTCKLRLLTPGLVVLTASATFDGSGDAVFTLGPTPASGMCCAEFDAEFYVDTEDWVAPVKVTFQFTG